MQRFLPLLLVVFVQQATAQSITWISACNDQVFCLNPGSCAEGAVFLTEKAVTICAGGFINYSYKVDLNDNGSIDIQSSDDTLSGPLPLGKHRITWRANDNCGNANTFCSYLITVKDCFPPNLLCRNGLTQNLVPPECQADFNVQDFIISVNDNCTPTNQIQMGIREAGDGTGFPAEQNISFNHCEQGLHILEIWVKDGNNLINQCNNYVLIQDNAGVCACNIDASIGLTGCARSVDSLRLETYTVRAEIEGNLPPNPPVSTFQLKAIQDSCFNLSFTALPLNGSYQGVVKGQRSTDPLAGVSTFDLVLINKHILGQQALKNFYQVFAADVNQSKSITTFDIIEIRKLILGIYDTFPTVPSWRLIQPIPDPTNLLSYSLVRDTYQFNIPNLLGDMSVGGFDFVGVKMGDANSNAALQGPAEDRGSAPPLQLLADDQVLETGEFVRVPLRCPESIRLDGWQLALQIDPDAFDILDLEGVAAENTALFPDGGLRIAQLYDAPTPFDPGEPLATLVLRAKKTTRLSDALFADATRLRPEAYSGTQAATRPIDFQLEKPRQGATVFPPSPNPFMNETTFGLYLDREQAIELEIFDLSGRRVYQSAGVRGAGFQTLHLPAKALPAAGVWMYRIQAGTDVSSGRLLRM